MIYVLFALLAGLFWAIWFILQWPLWVPLCGTALMALAAFGYFLWSTIRERRSAGALERAIAEQARLQEANASPQKRAEIQALQKQIEAGINALKGSRLGGKKRGAGALYSLPWYAIIGPPGAGKTTALKASGLQFPYADSSVRGVGGTRNCDWWFTNEAILLDTAGRYTTEHEDQAEWLSFLDMLRKYRSQKPLNGLIIAVSVPDIIDANETQLESMGKKLRARIDEVMTKLGMVLPVYFIVTKCDLIAGFNEFFADLRKSDRAQAWGATIPLAADRGNPAALLANEFDLLVREIHARAVKRLANERDRRAREAIYQFPLELYGIKRNLCDLVAQVFMVNAFQGTPTFRGFYFTSGTQEGAPMGRVLQRMGMAMGIQPAQYAQQQRVESKSYFLYDVFTKVVFPDAAVAARSASEIRRQRLTRIAVSATAMAVAFIFAIPSIISFRNNRDLLAEAKSAVEKAMKIDWKSTEPIRGRLDQLDPLRQKLEQIESYERGGVPVGLRFLMYSGGDVYRPLIAAYIYNMQLGFVTPCKFKLEKDLSVIRGEHYARERRELKTYLMLSDVEHLDVDYAAGRYTALWANINKPTSDVDTITLRKKMGPLVAYYFELIKPDSNLLKAAGKARATAVPANDKIVANARQVLMSVPPRKSCEQPGGTVRQCGRYLAMFVDTIEVELNDDALDDDDSNLRYPGVSLDKMFSDRKDVLQWLKSAQNESGKGYYKVPGPYTDRGHAAVLANISGAKQLLEREQWVVPLTEEEKGEKLARNIAALADDYENTYIEVWKGFLRDLQVKSPSTLEDAIALYSGDDDRGIAKTEWPYLRILRALEDHTQWHKPLSELANNKVATSIINRKLNAYATSRTGLRFNFDVNKIGDKTSKVPPAFKATVSFGVPQDTARSAIGDTSLAQYINFLSELRGKMNEALRKQADAGPTAVVLDLNKALSDSQALLKPLDQMAQTTLWPLLWQPLNVAGKLKVPPTVQ